MNKHLRFIRLLVAISGVLVLASCERPSPESVQRGYRGTGMDEVYNPRLVQAQVDAMHMPAPIPVIQSSGGPKATAIYKNVQVLQDLDVPHFIRTMTAITQWVAPDQGCTYCHNPANLASDEKYTKVVARRMIQMTQHINSDWKPHVSATGVTCFTCHAGNPVPANIWFKGVGPDASQTFAGNHAGKNMPAPLAGLSALPNDPFSSFLDGGDEIRVVSQTALPSGDRQSIKQTEWTYALMMSMSKSLGVNCTYCHNSRSFTDWDQSTPQRATAFYGIRMVRDLNVNYLDPLAGVFPAPRHGPAGDGPKVFCATCHQGNFKPLFGASMVKDFPELMGPGTGPMVPTAAPAKPATQAQGTPTNPVLASSITSKGNPN